MGDQGRWHDEGLPCNGLLQRGAESIPRKGLSLSLGQGELHLEATRSGVLQLPALLPTAFSCRHLILATNLSLGRARLIQAGTCCCNPPAPSRGSSAS